MFLKKGKRKKVKKIWLYGVGVLLLLNIAGVAGFMINDKLYSEGYAQQLQIANEKLVSNTQSVLVLKEPVQAGYKITPEMVSIEDKLQSNANGEYISGDDLEAIALVDIEAGVPITDRMVTHEVISKDTREEEFTTVSLMTNLKENEFIDVRILFPTGEDYSVLSKKKVRNLTLSANSFFSWLSEEEIVRFSSAVVDAYLNPGTKLYTTKYVEPAVQGDIEPTYVVRQSVIDLIKNNPNIVKVAEKTISAAARADLDRRLAAIDEATSASIVEGLSKEEQARESIVKGEATGIATSDTTMPVTGTDATTEYSQTTESGANQ